MERRKAFRYTQQSLADAVGLSLRTIQRFEDGDNIPMKSARKLAELFGVSPLDIISGDVPNGGVEPPPTVVTPFAREASPVIPGSELVGGKDFPIYAAAQGGPDGAAILSFDALEFTKRPEPLANEPGGFGMYVEGDSMEPAYRQGDIALIDPRRPPRQGDDVLLVASDALTGEQRAMIKQLVSYTYEEWHVRQFNPPEEFALKKTVWKQALWVVGSYKRR